MKPGPDLAERLRAEADRLAVDAPPLGALAKSGRRRTRLRSGAIAMSILVFAAVSVGLGLSVTQEDRAPSFAEGGRAPDPSYLQREDEQEYSNFERIFRDNPALVEEGSPGNQPGRADSSGALDNLVDTDSTASGSGEEGASFSATPATSPSGGPLASPRVIKTARLRLEVGEDTLSGTFAEVERLAGRHGGFVSDSFTRSDPARSGELTIRVPAAVFESVVADLKSLGRVEAQRISGVDVTADFVDLQARLRNWEAQERVLVRLMAEANTINESLQVQRELQGVRVEIERIQGQLRVLRDQTELASISLSIHEPGAEEEPPSERSAWDRAVGAATEVLAAMLVGLGYLLPILAALVILWLAARTVRSRRTD